MKELSSNKEWKKWGKTDPLFGVASWAGRDKKGANPWTDEEFYALGVSDWKDFRKHWESYGVDNASCLEIGCGAGRITKQLATYFCEVHALDVSSDIIEYAKKRIERPSVIFHVSNGSDIPLDDQSMSAVFSTHVFQHFDSLVAAKKYFGEIARVMKPSGTVMIHLPIYKWPRMGRIFRRIYKVQKHLEDVKARAKRLLMDYGMAKPIMRSLIYPVEFFYEVLPGLGFIDIEVSIFVTKSNNAPHPFIFATKKQ